MANIFLTLSKHVLARNAQAALQTNFVKGVLIGPPTKLAPALIVVQPVARVSISEARPAMAQPLKM